MVTAAATAAQAGPGAAILRQLLQFRGLAQPVHTHQLSEGADAALAAPGGSGGGGAIAVAEIARPASPRFQVGGGEGSPAGAVVAAEGVALALLLWLQLPYLQAP